MVATLDTPQKIRTVLTLCKSYTSKQKTIYKKLCAYLLSKYSFLRR